jgi:methionyl-tRNA formyltransferase
MLKILIIGQGSQTIQLIRELFSLEVTPNNIKSITVEGDFNLSYIEFLSYYGIKYNISNKNDFNLKSYSLISEFCPNIVISFSNPFIISEEVLLLKTKFINFHPGILPNYKGSLSTVHSLINQEMFVGGTWHYIDKGVDTGNIIKVIKIPSENFNAFTLNHKIFSLGIYCLGEVIEKVNNDYIGTIQEKVGNFYYNIFPNVSEFENELQKRITYFPPKFLL